MTKILFWNIRGLGAIGRRNQLRGLRNTHRVDAICLQETNKSDFSLWDLNSLSEGDSFEWSWTAANGHSGGTLTGINIAVAGVVAKDSGSFLSSLLVITKEDNFQWELINVYGPVQNDRKLDFIQEMDQKIVMGGDFNLMRYS
jgi:exonuclease III